MESLVRDAVGPFTRAMSLPLDAVTADAARGALLPAAAAVAHMPSLTLDAALLAEASRGGIVMPAGAVAVSPHGAAAAAVDEEGELVGILRRHASGGWRLRPNFRGDAAG